MNEHNPLLRFGAVLLSKMGRTMTLELGDELLAALGRILTTPGPDFDLSALAGVRAEYQGCTFQLERLADILDELRPLHQEHWAETERYRHGIALRPDYERMMGFERRNRFLLFTVRRDGQLVGNCAMYIDHSTHTSRLVATEDTLFLRESVRRGWLAKRFMQFVEECLRKIGVSEIRVSVKLNEDGTPMNSLPVLSRMGYRQTAVEMTKVFGEDHETQTAL